MRIRNHRRNKRKVALTSTAIEPPLFTLLVGLPSLLTDVLSWEIARSTMIDLSSTFKKFNTLFKNQLTLAKALHHAAWGKEENVTQLIQCLEKNPELLLQKSHVLTTGGHEVRNVTIYEFLLGSGDTELAKIIEPFFAKINKEKWEQFSELTQLKQFKKYEPHLTAILNQKPYDFDLLFEKIEKASSENIKDILQLNYEKKSELAKEIKNFKEAHRARVINKVEMHYNYQTLFQAMELFVTLPQDFDKEKKKLIWIHIIGCLQRILPTIERFLFAQGATQSVVKNNTSLLRDNKYAYDHETDFSPHFPNNSKFSSLGYRFAIWKNRVSILDFLDFSHFKNNLGFFKPYLRHKLETIGVKPQPDEMQKPLATHN